MQVRIGLIGAGFSANIHARAYRQVHGADAQIVAVAALPDSGADRFVREYGIPDLYDDFRRILDRADVNLVDLCVPNALHHPYVIAAAEAGKHVICEKPLTGYFGGKDAADPVGQTPKSVMLSEALCSADQMLDATRRAGVKLMYAENWVYCPVVQRTLELARASGGTILQIRAEESHSGSHATYAKSWSQAGGGALIRLATHPIGAALFLKRQEGIIRDGSPIRVASVTADVTDLTQIPSFQAETERWLVDDWYDVENWCVIVITFEDGSRAVVNSSDAVLGGMEDTLEVYLSNGRIKCDMGHSGLMKAFAPDPSVWGEAYIMEKADTKGGWSYPSVGEEWMLGYLQEIQDFVAAVAYNCQPLSTGELGRDVVELIYAAYQSAEEGRRIDLRKEA